MDRETRSRIETALGTHIAEARPLGVGFGLKGYAATLADGRQVAVKAARNAARSHLPLEAYMLEELGRLSELPVPEVYYSDPALLVMSWIENDGGAITKSAERHAAELLAALHARPFPHFGYGRDTLIGPLVQPNPEGDDWIAFFRDHRLQYMARRAHEEGQLPAAMLTRLETLAQRLGDYLSPPPYPSLIHGDLWTGNVLVKGGRIAGLVDPAIYCAHPEIELAFTTMFSTFGRAFFDAYEALAPLEPGFHECRKDIYNLYPYLVHVRLFGAGYLGGIDATLRRLGL